MKNYAVREVFDTLQGEGSRAGCRSVFVRFAGCNLWDGNPDHRARGKGACARWCDTDFAKGTATTGAALLEQMNTLWPSGVLPRWCVLTGGEPLLQVDADLLALLHGDGWRVAVETNGTVDNPAASDVDLLTCSPKRGGELKLRYCDELKVVLPGDEREPWTPAELQQMVRLLTPADLFVNPQDPIDPSVVQSSYLHPKALEEVRGRETYRANVKACIDFVKANPEWRVGLQLHKLLDVP